MTTLAGAIEISDLSPGVSLDGTEVIPADQFGNTIRITSQQIANKVVSDINADPAILSAFIIAISASVSLMSGAGRIEVPFTVVSGFTINWQTDTPFGYTSTYAVLLGNKMPKPLLWVLDGVSDEYNNIAFDCRVTRSLDDSIILKVVFDWAILQSGRLSF